MSLSTSMERLKYIDSLIRKKATGDLQTLAKKLHLSRSHTLRLLKEMKDEGFPIEYSKDIGSYYYSKEGKLAPSLFLQNLSTKEMQHINGGKILLPIMPESHQKQASRSLPDEKSIFKLFLRSHYMRLWQNNFVE